MENIKNKQIVILIGIIFIAFVGYKIISSSIQENKEKAVLQERARLKELEKMPLSQCIEQIEKNMAWDIQIIKDTKNEMSTEKFQYDCRNLDGHLSIPPFRVNTKEYCEPMSYEEFAMELKEIEEKANLKKEECYKRYK